ncbi:MAG: hypothetical protein E7427_07080 [Ruminococcaceae bacterium]|nr:hypothetical protein [Oscillospiraceae bacterium]
MDIKQAQELLRRGVEPSPDYPDLPNDYTAAELIAFDPMAELEYRMVKDRHPGMTRSKLVQNWRAFRIGRIGAPEEGGAGGPGAVLRNLAGLLKKRRD